VIGPLSYEPSIEAVLAELLRASRLVGGGAGLRRRVSRPVLARSTGLGEIGGGEVVLAPAGRGREILAHLEDLEAVGVVGVVVAGEDVAEHQDAPSHRIPVIQAEPGTDMRRLQADIERYIARRRRELFALDQRLHRSLTEAAIGGAEVEELLAAAAGIAGKAAALDRDGDVMLQPSAAEPLSPETLVGTRIALHRAAGGAVQIEGPPSVLASPVMAGSEKKGIVMLLGAGMPTLDEDEAVLRSMASACAIALARAPEEPISTIEGVLQTFARRTGRVHTPAWDRVTALGLTDASSSLRQIDRAVRAELSMRGIEHVTGSARGDLIALIAGGEDLPWDPIVRSIALRLGTSELRAGLGRERSSIDEGAQSVWEAQETLRHTDSGGLTRFPQIELSTLLRSEPGWVDFARGRLGPLLEGGTGNEDLLRTLRAYLEAGQNAKEAARALHVHRNTLLYRLKRVRDVLGVELENADVLFELDLSLRVMEVMSPQTRTQAREA
jgi:purine catabolism regulator